MKYDCDSKDETNFSHDLLLTDTQALSFVKLFQMVHRLR